MRRCPICKNLSVGYDSYRKAYRCTMPGCSCIVVDETTYSYLKKEKNGTVVRVELSNGGTRVVKEYKVA